MRISTGGRYALRSMLDLALNSGEGPVLRQEIADRQAISAEYIAQLFRRLARNGLVRGIMGPGGGYLLGREADKITLGDIFRAAEGPVAVVACVMPGGELVCKRVSTCITRRVWIRLSIAINQFLDATTLDDLVKESRQFGSDWVDGCPPVLEAFTDSLEEPCRE